jgi:glutaredoxin
MGAVYSSPVDTSLKDPRPFFRLLPFDSPAGGRVILIGLIGFVFVFSACKNAEPSGETKGPSDSKPDKPPPDVKVSAARKDLVFSYPTEEGQFATATTIDAIPEKARRSVVVTDLSLTPEQRQSGRYIYITDLRTARGDGTYPVAIASRFGFEAKLSGTSTASGSGGGKDVVVYSAAWCGVCKHAKQLLKSWNVHFVDKDIEASRSAAEELAMKAKQAGIQPGGVPVIDVGGTLLQGLDEGTLRGVLKEKGLLR